MKFIKLKKVPFLFSILCLALLSLMIFQVNWLSTSHKLIKEQFDQKVNMAIGSTLAELNTKSINQSDIQEFQICGDEDNKFFSMKELGMTEAARSDIENTLDEYMACYGIDQKYKVEFLDSSCTPANNAYCCSLGSLKNCKDSEATLGISFFNKSNYLFDKMLPMILSSVLVFLLLASVSFIILWSLVKQKRLTENNIDFFNNTAHELKTPLTNISLALKLLGKKYAFINDNKYAHIIRAENTKLKNQIDRVLFLSRMDSKEFALKKEAIELKKLIYEVSNNFELIVKEKSAVLNFDLPQQEVVISGDYYHFSNVINNLIDNAIKYCNESPVINISLEQDEGHVKLSISDNGIGISPKDQNHIFEKFQRVNTGNIRMAKGFGLGLSYVKKVMELHKGIVSVESDLKKGSQFNLLIPISA